MHDLVMANDLDGMAEEFAKHPDAINARNDEGLPPLFTAVLHRNHLAPDFLLLRGAKLDIFAAAYLNDVSGADHLLQESPKLVDAVTPDGKTPLHDVALAGRFPAANRLPPRGKMQYNR